VEACALIEWNAAVNAVLSLIQVPRPDILDVAHASSSRMSIAGLPKRIISGRHEHVRRWSALLSESELQAWQARKRVTSIMEHARRKMVTSESSELFSLQ
jgi:hypothetical protein